MNFQTKETGFALLITLIVVGVVLSVGLSILDLTIKQVKLASSATNSEYAFHAANAGMECAQYWRRASSTEMETGQAINPTCFGVTPTNNQHQQIAHGQVNDPGPRAVGQGDVYQYTFDFSWGGANPRCTQINTVVASSSALGPGVTTTYMTTLVPNYPDGRDKYCEPGSRCTVMSVKGYNRPCSTVGGYGVVQREVLLQF